MNLRQLKSHLSIVLLLALLFAGAGCMGLKQHHFPGDADWPQPYLMFLPGGPGAIADDVDRFKTMRSGGYRGEIEVFEWTDAQHKNIKLMYSYLRNRGLATLAAQRITDVHRADPARPIYLWGVSAGAMMVIWILEDLPEDVKVDVAIVTVPMVSRQYDLSKALRRVSGKFYSFNNPADYMISGLATTLFGTMDRKHQICAGEFNFIMPPGADKVQYEKFVRKPHEWRWVQQSNFGLHMSSSSYPFVAEILVPLLKPTPLDLNATAEP